MAKKLTFTARQIEMIQHRLDVPECIGQALGYVDELGNDLDGADELYAAVDRVEVAIKNGTAGDLDPLAVDVLVDCFVGSTWLAGAEQEFTPSVFGAMAKSFDMAAQKVADHFRIAMELPPEARSPVIEPTGADPSTGDTVFSAPPAIAGERVPVPVRKMQR